jgi:branched-chain amino acid transport system permease protein
MGYTGLPLFSQVAFFALGAYSAAIAYENGYPFLVGLLLGALFPAFCGFLIAYPALRVRGDYFAIVTMGFAEIIYDVIHNEVWLTRGPYGISVGQPVIFGFKVDSYPTYLLLAIILTAITFVTIQRLVGSPYGRVLKATRDDELAASVIGKNTWKYKQQVIIIAALFSGIAGVYFAHYTRFVNDSPFTLAFTTTVMASVILGGLANNYGTFIGVALMLSFPEVLRVFIVTSENVGYIQQIVIGAMLISVMLIRTKRITVRKHAERRSMKDVIEN